MNVALVTALVLLIPLLAMRFTDEVAWSPADFAVAGALLFGAGFTYKAIAGKSVNATCRLAVAVALGAALLLVWLNLAVGLAMSRGAADREIAAIVLLNGFFVALFIGSAWLFRRASQGR